MSSVQTRPAPRAPSPSAEPAPRRSPARALLSACRPRQWVKNLLVLAAPAAAGVLDRPGVLADVMLAFVSFSLLASSVYLVNDVCDLEEDRAHPRKSMRPIACGELPARAALVAAAVLALAGIACGLAVTGLVAALGAGYLALTLSYTLRWRSVPILDVLAIAGGFVLRTLAGGAAAQVPVSRAFVAVTVGGALFIAAGKRYAELRNRRDDGAPTRESLRGYSQRAARGIAIGSAGLALVAYVTWALRRPDYGSIPWFELSATPFALWLGRYALLLRRGAGEAPEELVLHDAWLKAITVIWLSLFAFGVYARV